jgi:tetratricopeptide (TPR) repeat protein
MRLDQSLLTIALVFSTGILTACPEKKPAAPSAEELEAMAPDQAFNQAVTILQSPNRDGIVDFQAAYEVLTIGIRNGGGSNAYMLFNAGWTAERLGKFDAARRHYRDSLKAEPTFKNAMFNLGSLLSTQGRADQASEIYGIYLEHAPDDLAVRNNLVESLLNAGKHDEAIAEAQLILVKDEANTAAYRNLSRIYYDLGQTEMALLTAEKTRMLNDSDPGTYNNLGIIYLKQGDDASAIEAFKNALKLDPKSVEASLNLGWVALASGDYALAKTRFEVVQQNAPENVDGLLGLAIAYRGHKDYDKAAKLYETAIRIDPKNDLAYQNASMLHQKYTNDFAKARQYLEDWKTALVGNPAYGLDHVVHNLIQEVDSARGEWEADQAEIARQKREAEDLRKAQLAQLKELEKRVKAYQKKIDGLCSLIADMGMLEDFQMIADTAKETIAAQDFATAQQLFPMISEMEETIDVDLAPLCAEGSDMAPEEAPAEEAPAEEAPTEEAPAEEAPAEEAPTEEAPAEGGE